MNNFGNLSVKNSSAINRKHKYPISAIANSTINMKDGNLNLQNNVIFTEATASNASVAAARATAKAASIATSSITNERSYLYNNDDPLEKSVTFQISTLCTIQRTKSDDLTNNSKIQTDTVKYLNQRLYSNTEIEKINVSEITQINKGTKFEKLRRELDSLEQNKNISCNNDHNVSKRYYNSNKINDNSIYSNQSTLSSCQSDQPIYFSVLSETLNYSSDGSNATSCGNKIDTNGKQRNLFLSADNESSDNSSNLKKYKISDLKKHSKFNNTCFIDLSQTNNLKNINDVHIIDKEANSMHYMKTVPGTSSIKSLAITNNLGTLISSSSLLPETDIDSGTISENYFFPQTHFSGDQPIYSFEKTRSLVDLRKSSETDYKNDINKAISTEDLKKSRPAEECDLIKRLKSKAQSTQELRIADSLTKLNVPQWMNDFKLSSIKKNEVITRTPKFGTATITFKTLKHHDSILSKYKYTSLPLNKPVNLIKDSQINKVLLPSSFYRTKSQNLVYFNPKEDSKLSNHKETNIKPIINSLSLKGLNETDINKSDFKYAVNDHLELRAIENLTPMNSLNPNVIVRKEIDYNHLGEQGEVIRQDKKESDFILNVLINSTQNQTIFDEKLCECFLINPPALKLLLNVKRKTPNLNRDETYINSKQNENISIENPIMKKKNKNNYIICHFKNCEKEILQTNNDRSNCSCYNCYTYYCSKKCRNNDFLCHLSICSFSRINNMILKVKDSLSENHIYYLSKFAQEHNFKYGDGTVIIAFESCRAADDFLNGQSNRLMSQPYYLSRFKIKNFLPLFKMLEYDSLKEYVITIIIIATLPMTNIEFSYPTFRYSYKVKYLEKLNPDKVKLPRSANNQKANDMFKDLEIRKKYFDYVINFFKAKNINLDQSHAILYNKLETYLNEGLLFESMKIFIKDSLINATVACIICPNKEIISTVIRNVSLKTPTFTKDTNNNANKMITETEI